MRPEPVEGCQSEGFDKLSPQNSSAHVGLLGRRSDEMPEHLGLHGIGRGRVFWMPLDAEIPACMILQGHSFDHTIG
jgi:hypothetical protein